MGSAQLSIRIEYRRNERTVAQIDVAGNLLSPTLPYDLTLRRMDSGHYVITEPPDKSLTGRLTLPFIGTQGSIAFVDLDVPSSGVFTQDDLEQLWEAGRELADWRARAALATNADDPADPEIKGRALVIANWRTLAACAQDAGALLAQWPSVLDRRSTWLPVGIPGGIEDLERTERDADQLGYVGAEFGVSQSARWVGTTRPVPSNAVMVMARAVLELVRSTVDQDDERRLFPMLSPIGQVATRAASPRAHHDPDPSSWPPAFTSFVTSCMRVIVELAVSQRGGGALPLLDTSELYEAWLAVTIRGLLDQRFGPWTTGGSGALAAWQADDTTFELWVKPTFGRQATVIGGEAFYGVVADLLTPDLLLSASRDEYTEVTVLDAKAWKTMLPEDALSQSAKYLYGIRRIANPDAIPVLAGVDLVTCAHAPSLHDSQLARIGVVTATPTRGLTTLDSRVMTIVDQLKDSLIERERQASTY